MPKKKPSKELAIVTTPDAAQDALMGQQLTEQYHRAVGGMREVVKFGALMMLLREKVDSARGVNSPKSGPGTKGTGVKAWLQTYAPEVSEQKAYRFLHVAESVQSEFPLPAKVAKQIGFASLVTSEPEKLPDNAKAAQLKLFEFVDGTSQRSWLDRFKPPAKLGGKREKAKKLTPAEQLALEAKAAEQDYQQILSLMDGFFRTGKHAKLSSDSRRMFREFLFEARKQLEGVGE